MIIGEYTDSLELAFDSRIIDRRASKGESFIIIEELRFKIKHGNSQYYDYVCIDINTGRMMKFHSEVMKANTNITPEDIRIKQ